MKEYCKSKSGLIAKMYGSQKGNSKQRGHKPPTYTKEELKEWLYDQESFHTLHKIWAKNGYKKAEIPSIDRIDDYKGYSFDNIQLMTWRENSEKQHKNEKLGLFKARVKPVLKLTLKGDIVEEYCSVREASRKNKINSGDITNTCKGKYKTYKGFKWEYKEKKSN